MLQSDELLVEVMEPDAPDSYYRGNRFSPVANVLRVTADARDFLFSPVRHDPLLENAGLAMEFDLLQWPEGGPPGYHEAAAGEPFLKVGVGVLKKPEGDYGFYKTYETLRLPVTEVEWGPNWARFKQACGMESGYGYALMAEVRVTGRRVVITYRLRNTGRKPFATEHYAHNYFCFEEAPIGRAYRLEFSGDFQLEKPGDSPLQKSARELRFGADIPRGKAINGRVVLAPPSADGESVTVRHVSGLAVIASVSRPTSHVAVHASPAYLCPEQFVRLQLEPGEETEWVRTYEFILPP